LSGGGGCNPAPSKPLAGGHAGTGCGTMRRCWPSHTPRRAARAMPSTGSTGIATTRAASTEAARVRIEFGETCCRRPWA
jgi:hypothetical protein